MKNAVIANRQLVGMAIVALANPLIYFGGGFYQWSITFVAPLLFAAVVYGLYALFRTKRAKESWPGSFFALAWILLGLTVLVPWMDKSPRQTPVTQSSPSRQDKSEGVNKKYLTDENRNPIQSSIPPEKPGEVDFFLLMALPHASEASNYEKIIRIHPDAPQISSSDNFKKWALNNPKTWSAIKNHDTDGLISVFSDYKSKK